MYDQYDGLIFDMDGTLIDSGKLHEFAWIDALNAHDIPVDRPLMASLAGVPTWQTVELLLEKFKPNVQAITAKVVEHKERYIDQHILEFIQPTALAETAKAYHGRKPMAVGTGATQASAEIMLKACGILELFDCIVGGDLVENHKPSPDTFLLCAEKIGVAPEKCVVFEDSNLGLEAGRNANMAVVDVQNELNIKNDYFL